MADKAHRTENVKAADKASRSSKKVPAELSRDAGQAGKLLLQQAVKDPQARPIAVLDLHPTYGNQAVNRVIQASLTVGPAGDHYEQEADRVAEQVLAIPAHLSGSAVTGGHSTARRQVEDVTAVQGKPLAATITPLVRRQEEEELDESPLQRQEEEELEEGPLQRQEEEELEESPLQRQEEEDLEEGSLQRQDEDELEEGALQRLEEEEALQEKRAGSQLYRQEGRGFDAGPAVADRLAARQGGGKPLTTEAREFMEPRFGTDFAGVRVHTDAEAGGISRDLGARAFTHGQDIYMGAGRYDSGSTEGKRLLAHELTHVVQQTGWAQPKIQRWSIRSRIKSLPEGHELLTAESISNAGLTKEDLKELGLQESDIVAGSTWNDLPGAQLLHRVHYGDLQFLHSMASNPLETAGQTLEKVLMWAEFCYKVGTGVIDPETALGEVPVAGFPDLWEGRFRNWTVKYLFTTMGSATVAKGKAVGSMLHMLQDSFCASHVERVGASRRGEEVARIKSFHAYPEQHSGRHGLADLLGEGQNLQERIKATAGAQDAVNVGKNVLVYLKNGAPWVVVKSYLQTALALVEPDKQGEGGPGEAGPGRQFRKSVHEKYMKDSAVRWKRRGMALRGIDTASKAYDQMLLYKSTVLSPEEAKKKLMTEMLAVETVLRCIYYWRQVASRSEKDERGQAVNDLETAMIADEETVRGEMGDIDRALSH
jgi:hypothetical protein